MMSKNSFWVNCKENLKRRSWTLLLCALALFLALPVRLAMELSVESRRILQDPSWIGEMTRGEWLGSIFMRYLSDTLFILLVFALAILLAVQGFSWMDSRRKLDLYMSVPVSARKRFAVIYLNGASIFAASYLAMLILTLAMGGVMGAVSGKELLYALIMYFGNLLFFMVCYNVAIIAVMLTGNVLVSLLAATVLLFYEYVVRWLFDGMRSSFFATYCDLSDVTGRAFTSPVVSWVIKSSELLEYFSGYGSRYLVSFGKLLVLLVVQMAAYGLFAWFLYRKRRAEAAGNALAFDWIRTPVKLLLMVPITLLSGMWFWQLADYSIPFAVVGMFIGLFLSHGLFQILYEFDVRSILKAKWHLFAAGAASAVIFAIFTLDLTGYDAWIPKTEKIESVGVAFRSDSYYFGFYENLFGRDMYHEEPEKYMLSVMASEDEDTIAAVRKLAADAAEQRRKSDGGRGRRYYSASDGVTPVSLRYTLTDGRRVYRAVWVDVEDSARELDAVFADADFQTARYQICDPSFIERSGEMSVSYGNGLNRVPYLADARELLEAYGRDLSEYSYSLMLNSLPVGKLSFTWSPYGAEEREYTWEYPVYEEFSETMVLLREQGVYTEHMEGDSILSEDQLVSVSLTCYNLRETDVEYNYDGSRAVSYTSDQEVTRTYTDAEQIEQILPALYPESLSDVAGGGITGKLWNDNYEASIIFQPDEYFSEGYLYFTVLEDRLPEFVLEEIRKTE